MATLNGGAFTRVDFDPSPRSSRVQVELRKHWKHVVKRLPPARRERWLDSQEGRSALGAATCNQLLKAIRGQFAAFAEAAASAAWVEAWAYRPAEAGELPAGLEFDAKGKLVYRPPAGAGNVRLVLGPQAVRNGMEHPPGTDPQAMAIAGPPTRRWTPPQAAADENRLDVMTPREAAQHTVEYDAPSPSAHAIQQIEMRGGVEQRSFPTSRH